jgi:hypothetical protein
MSQQTLPFTFPPVLLRTLLIPLHVVLEADWEQEDILMLKTRAN